MVGCITHGHFACYDAAMDADAKCRFVVEGVVEFLEALFEDRVLLWSHTDGGSGGFEILHDRPDCIHQIRMSIGFCGRVRLETNHEKAAEQLA